MLEKATFKPFIKETHVVILRFNNFELEFESSQDAVDFILQYTQQQDKIHEVEDDYQVL